MSLVVVAMMKNSRDTRKNSHTLYTAKLSHFALSNIYVN